MPDKVAVPCTETGAEVVSLLVAETLMVGDITVRLGLLGVNAMGVFKFTVPFHRTLPKPPKTTPEFSVLVPASSTVPVLPALKIPAWVLVLAPKLKVPLSTFTVPVLVLLKLTPPIL